MATVRWHRWKDQRAANPALGPGWLPAGPSTDATAPSPYDATYSWSAGDTSPGTMSWTATDVAGNSSTGSFNVINDPAGPTGGSMAYTGGLTNGTSRDLTFTLG